MSLSILKKIAAGFVLAGLTQFAFADNHMPAAAIADILADMEHFPSDAEQSQLMEISNNESNSEAVRTIAQAIHDMEHSVSDMHQSTLEEIANDSSADESARDLAQVVLNFNHMVSDSDQEVLASIGN